MNTSTKNRFLTLRALLLLVAFLVVVIGVGGLIGVSLAPGIWYTTLAKPPFNLPDWVFGPVWSVLYVLIAIAGWRSFILEPKGLAIKLWGAQMVLNWLWTPVWFGLHLIWPAFFVIIALLAVIVSFVIVTREHDRISAWLFVPYVVWVAFASILNLSIAVLN